MPLNTQIIREGDPMKLRWSGFHVASMAMAAALDQGVKKCKLWEEPQKVFDELERDGYIDPSGTSTDKPIGVPPSLAWRLGYGELSLTPLNSGEYTLKHRHLFVDVTDGEVLDLQPGDKLVAFRSMK